MTIRTGTYAEFADQQIGDMEAGERLHGGSFNNLLVNRPYDAAHVFRVFTELFGEYATAAEFAAQCDWNSADDAHRFVEENPEWPPRAIVEELKYT